MSEALGDHPNLFQAVDKPLVLPLQRLDPRLERGHPVPHAFPRFLVRVFAQGA